MKILLAIALLLGPAAFAQTVRLPPPSLADPEDASSLPDDLERLSTQASPEPFIQELYHELQQPPAPPPFVGSHGASHIYAKPLLNSMHREFTASNRGFAGQLAFNPFCACQNSAGLTLSPIVLAPVDGKHVDATLKVHLPPVSGAAVPDRNIVLHMVRLEKGWRVDDISSSEVHSLKLLLRNPADQ